MGTKLFTLDYLHVFVVHELLLFTEVLPLLRSATNSLD